MKGIDQTKLKLKLSSVLPHLNEKQRRMLVACEAVSIGYGGIKLLSEITGLDKKTIRRGIEDLGENEVEPKQIRKPGGGRKRCAEINPALYELIESIIEPDTRGDPESPLRWTCKSVRNIADFLESKGISISHQTISKILHDLDYSLQGNRKTKEGNSHPDRDKQFRYINKMVKKFFSSKNPVISVDTKKKELVGNYKNAGRERRKKGEPLEVNSHDFPDPSVEKAIPYGVYDIANNKGWVSIGISSDTAEFAVASITSWWKKMGVKQYPKTDHLLVCADAGGSNSYRSRLWKKELQLFCDKFRLKVTVCHFPPGTSKWNKIEHRLFSFISINWRGKPLTTYQVIINLIKATKSKSGLTVDARLDKRDYKKGKKVTDAEMKKIKIKSHKFQGKWNYTISPSH